ncbi:phosphoglycerate kinase [Nanoarchaeota archaeon]
MKLFSLNDFPIRNKTILVRVDYNVPLKKGKVIDSTKIKASLPTIHYLLQKNCKIILMTHLGRPKGKTISNLKTKVLIKEIKKILPKLKITSLNSCIGQEVRDKIQQGKGKEIFLLENLRFYKEEKENDSVFAHSLADLADFYINDAFGVSHRKHASVNAITKFIPSAYGFLLSKEINQLSKVLKPKKPLTWIIGGAKLDKVDLIKNSLKKADYIIIGGALAFSFLKAKGYGVGMSKIDSKSVRIAKKILRNRNSKKIVLPIDVIVSSTSSSGVKPEVVPVNRIPINKIGFDIGPKTIKLFSDYLKKSKTIVWNGPLGYFENEKFQKGTKSITNLLSKLSAVTIIGGGETSEAIHKFKLTKRMTHISTGGGASLEFLTGKKLPAIKALEKNYKSFKRKIEVK